MDLVTVLASTERTDGDTNTALGSPRRRLAAQRYPRAPPRKTPHHVKAARRAADEHQDSNVAPGSIAAPRGSLPGAQTASWRDAAAAARLSPPAETQLRQSASSCWGKGHEISRRQYRRRHSVNSVASMAPYWPTRGATANPICVGSVQHHIAIHPSPESWKSGG